MDDINARSRFGGEAVKELPNILSHGEFTKHVSVVPSPPLILQSPVAEIMLAYFPPDISKARRDNTLAQFQQFVERGLNKCPDFRGVSYGWGAENDFPVRGEQEGQVGSVFMAFIGWPSVDAHVEFQETEAFKENIHFIRTMEGIIKLATFHISCRTIRRKTE